MACGRPSRRRRVPRAVRAWLRSLVTGGGGGPAAARTARHAKMPARAAGRSEAPRDTSPAVRAWLLRGDQEVLRACILSKVPVPWYRYLAAQRGRAAHVKARGPVARVSSERRSVSARSPLHRSRCPGSPTTTHDLRDGSQASSSLERSSGGRPRMPRNFEDRQERPQFGEGREIVS